MVHLIFQRQNGFQLYLLPTEKEQPEEKKDKKFALSSKAHQP
jgi:hypothetical protein